MARNRVEFIITSDDGKAIQQLNKLLEKSREMGSSLEDSGKKGKSAFDSIGKGVSEIVMGMATFEGGLKIAGDLADVLKDRLKGVTDEMKRAGQESKGYTEAMGRLLANMPGESRQTIIKVDEDLRKIAGSSSIGPGGLSRLTDAMTTVQSSIPLAPMGTKMDVIREVAQQLQLEPTADASGVALGYAKLLEADPTLTANMAQNLLTTQQSLGLVKDVGKVSAMIPQLGTAAREAGMSMADMQALAAFSTQVIGDTEGTQTTTLLGSIASKIMNQSAKVEELTGIKLTGSGLERMQQLSTARANGEIADEAWTQLMPTIGAEGVGGRMLMSSLTDSYRQQQLSETLSAMRSDDIRRGDLVGDLIDLKQSIPGATSDMELRRTQSAAGSLRAGNDEYASIYAGSEAYREELGLAAYGERYIEAAVDRYIAMRMTGSPEDVARKQGAYAARVDMIPLAGSWFNDLDNLAIRNVPGYAKFMERAVETSTDPLTEDQIVAGLRRLIREEAPGATNVPTSRLNLNLDQ